MRPKKTRWVKCSPVERIFTPKKGEDKISDPVVLTLDEFEAVRLLDYEGLSQVEVAKRMRVHRSTISRIICQARNKIADALVGIKPLKIEGGCCKVVQHK